MQIIYYCTYDSHHYSHYSILLSLHCDCDDDYCYALCQLLLFSLLSCIVVLTCGAGLMSCIVLMLNCDAACYVKPEMWNPLRLSSYLGLCLTFGLAIAPTGMHIGPFPAVGPLILVCALCVQFMCHWFDCCANCLYRINCGALVVVVVVWLLALWLWCWTVVQNCGAG